MSARAPGVEELLGRAMAPGRRAGDVLEALFAATGAWIEAGEGTVPRTSAPPADGSLGARLARHAAAMLAGGASPVAAFDDTMVLAAFAGESEAERTGSELPDVRAWIGRFRGYERELLVRAPGRPASLRNPSRNLQLMITRRCQLRCAYCPVVKGDADMPREVVEAAVDLLLTTRRPSLRLDFTGGEPLLRYDEVLSAAERLLQGAERLGKRADFYLVTNGFELDASRARRLADLGFRVELSLDGEPDLHNRSKIPMEPGTDAYTATRRALDAALAEGLDHTVVMVATPRTVGDLGRSFDHVIACGARSIDVNYAIGRRWQGGRLHAFLAALEGIGRQHAPRIAEGSVVLGNLASRVEPSLLNGEWMADTDGSLHRMTEWALETSRPAGSEDRGVGYVGDPRGWDDLYTSRFLAYEALLETYAWRDPELRTTLLDNVRTGRAVAECAARIARSLR